MSIRSFFITTLSLISIIIWYVGNSLLRVNIGNSYYIIFAVTFLLLLPGKRIRINTAYLFLFIICLASILLNDIPFYFRSEQRLYAFGLMLAAIGPLVYNQNLIEYKKVLFNLLNRGIILLTLGSFVILLFRIPIGFGYSGFFGLFNQSMFLGPMAGISSIVCLYYFYSRKKHKTIILFIFVASIMTCIGAGSRAALLATIAGILSFIYTQSRGKVLRYMQSIIFVSIIGLGSFPLWQNYTQHLIRKIESSEMRGSYTSSRDFLWEARLYEFESSPIYGIGFAAADPLVSAKINFDTGGIEPGSSWLAVLAMTGVIGFGYLAILLMRYIRFILMNKVDVIKNSLFLGLIVFFILHFIAEGYIFAAGSGLFLYFWLLIANIDIYRTQILQSN